MSDVGRSGAGFPGAQRDHLHRQAVGHLAGELGLQRVERLGHEDGQVGHDERPGVAVSRDDDAMELVRGDAD